MMLNLSKLLKMFEEMLKIDVRESKGELGRARESKRSGNRTLWAREWEVPKVYGLGNGQFRNKSGLKVGVDEWRSTR